MATFNKITKFIIYWWTMVYGLFYRSDRYRHQVRLLAEERVRLRKKLCDSHVCVKSILRKEDDKWVRYNYIAIDGHPIREFNTAADIDFLSKHRDIYYRLHKHTIFEKQTI